MRSALRQDYTSSNTCRLSILICGLPIADRMANLSLLYKKLNSQKIGKSVEVIALTDFKDMTVGEKRNLLVQMSTGDYIVFIDDDDDISDDYIKTILEAAESDPCCVSIKQFQTTEGINRTLVDFSILHGKNYNVRGEKRMIPNHTCAVRSDIVKRHPFDHINLSEDHKYAVNILPELIDEVRIDRAIYFYKFSRSTSQTRGR